MIISQINSLVISEFTKNQSSNIWNKEIIQKVNDFLSISAINDKVEVDDVTWIKNSEDLASYISNIAIEEFENLKKDAISEIEYFGLERRIVLSSIDELWMRHIDSMSKLREEVAFEWYSWKNPLIVYKEKAYFKFKDLINEIEYKVVKSIFSIRKNEQIEQIDLSKQNLEFNEVDLEELLKIKKDDENKNKNPILSSNNKDVITKIRV